VIESSSRTTTRAVVCDLCDEVLLHLEAVENLAEPQSDLVSALEPARLHRAMIGATAPRSRTRALAFSGPLDGE